MTEDVTATYTVQQFIEAFAIGQSVTHIDANGRYSDRRVEVLFHELLENRLSILPYFVAGRDDFWMIAGEHSQKLDAFVRTVSRFLVPSFATFSGGKPFIHQFNPTNQLGKIGSTLFVGYYRLVSSPKDRDSILTRLNECLHVLNAVEDESALTMGLQSYRVLLDAFQRALTANQWNEAENLLTTISGNHMTSAENADFLRITWLARQSLWTEIWEHPHFNQLATLPVPKQIRAYMLTAFHAVHLSEAELEEDWDKAIAIVGEYRSQLAMLLMGRFGLVHPAVLRVYAYLAVLDETRDALTKVADDVPKDDFQSRLIVSALLEKLPSDTVMLERSPEAELQEALDIGDYDAAWLISESLIDPIQRLASRIQIAYLSQESSLAQQVLDEHERLYVEHLQALHDRYPRVDDWTRTIQQRAMRSETSDIRSWPEWFQVAQETSNPSELIPALDRLVVETDLADWSSHEFAQLSERLAEVPNEHYKRYESYRRAIQQLTNLCINDDDFPREYSEAVDVYEYLLLFIEQDDKTATNTNLLLRLQEALLAHRPSELAQASERMKSWFETPRPVLQDYMLESLELLATYGAEPANFYQWFREWMESISRSPVVNASTLFVWLSFARWMQADEAIIGSVEKHLSEQLENEDHLVLLPAKTQIAIFTFDEASAKRAQGVIWERNPALDVRIHTGHVNNESVQSLARRADYVVLVTTCISHAISYAVEPLADDRLVLPRSRGASSILQALEEKVKQSIGSL